MCLQFTLKSLHSVWLVKLWPLLLISAKLGEGHDVKQFVKRLNTWEFEWLRWIRRNYPLIRNPFPWIISAVTVWEFQRGLTRGRTASIDFAKKRHSKSRKPGSGINVIWNFMNFQILIFDKHVTVSLTVSFHEIHLIFHKNIETTH